MTSTTSTATSAGAAEPSADDLFAVVEEVWATFLDAEQPILATENSTGSASPGSLSPGQAAAWTAAVTVTGAWDAAVLMSFPAALAAVVTERMLGMQPAGDPPSDVDVVDALGELVNIVGGNVKSLMPGPGKLSLPLVAQGAVGSSSSMVEARRLDLGWAGHQLRVVVEVPSGSGRPVDLRSVS